MHVDRQPSHRADAGRRAGRGTLFLLVLALTLPALGACKEVKPGSGVETIAKSRAQTSVSGR